MWAISSEILCWFVTFTLMLGGVAGTILPFVPGPLVVLVGAIVHALWMPDRASSWIAFTILGVIVIIAYIVEFFSGAAGARWFGASRWGMFGALAGGIVGIFFSLPGLILGPLIGAFAFEILFAKQKTGPATKSTVGTVVGTVAGGAIKLGLTILMVLVWAGDVFLL